MPFLLKLVLKKCCYPELGARARTGAGQDWTNTKNKYQLNLSLTGW